MTPRRRIIPLFVPHLGCTHGCVFCNQRSISGQVRPVTPEGAAALLGAASAGLTPGTPVQYAFYGGSFTAIPAAEQDALLAAAAPFLEENGNASIRISTRPDCVDAETLGRLAGRGVRTVELGAQSMCDDVLMASGRGHSARDTQHAAGLVRQAGLELILQMMTGLPGDTPEKALLTARRLVDLRPDGVRVYPTVVLRGTRLCDMWEKGLYRAHTVEEAVGQCAALWEVFEEARVPVIRMGLNPSEELSENAVVAGAYHPAFGELVRGRVCLDRARGLLRGAGAARSVTFGVAAGCVSWLVGQKRSNILALKREFGLDDVAVSETDGLRPGEITVLRLEKAP